MIFRLLIALLLAVTVEAASPTIAITGAAVEPNGAFIDIYMPFTVNTNGTFSFGYGSNNVPSTSTPYYKVVCPGYDDTAATNTISWAGFLTYPIRMAYPNATTNNIVVSGSSIIIPVAMSEFVYSNDVSGTLTFPVDGWYAQGGTNTAAGTVAITNNSTLAYPKVIANWSYPGTRQRIYGPTWTNRVVAFHQSGINGRPVRVVKFYGQQGANVVSPVLVTKPEIDHSIPDAAPVTEYVCRTLSTNGLANLSVVTNNFAAYPWRGDPNSVLDTGDGVRTLDTSPLYSPQKWWSTYADSYGTLVCVVATSGGNQHGGIVPYSQFTPDVTLLLPFDTIDHALVDLKASNNLYYSHNDCGGGIIYLTNSTTHAWLGGASGGYNTTPPTFCTIAAYPGRTPYDVIISTQNGAKAASGTDHLVGVGFTATNATSIVTGETYWWVDKVVVSNIIQVPVAPFYQNTLTWVTDSQYTQCTQAGLGTYASVNAPFQIIRGNFTDGLSGGNGIFGYTVLGNKKTATQTASGMINFATGQTIPQLDNLIWAYNQFYGWKSGNNAMQCNSTSTNTGVAIIQNIIESTGTSGATQIGQVWADAADNSDGGVTNVVCWYNTFLGAKWNHGYNDSQVAGGGANPNRVLWSLRKNFMDVSAIKFDTSLTTKNGARTNNWTQAWGVGNYGNAVSAITNINSAGAFCYEWLGVLSYENRPVGEQNADNGGAGFSSKTNAWPFVNPQRYDGVNNNTPGSGDYNWQSTAFILDVHSGNAANTQPWYALPYDSNGAPRGGFDPPDAFVGGQPRRTGMMFAN